jgi:hypothetical protein
MICWYPLMSRILELEDGAIHRWKFTVDMPAVVIVPASTGFAHPYTVLGIRHDWRISVAQALGDGQQQLFLHRGRVGPS